MSAGEIADGAGSIWFRAFGDGPVLTPDDLGKMDFGMVWVTDAQACAAEAFGWVRVPGWPHDSLVAIERSEAEARIRLSRDQALSELAQLDGEIL